MQEAVQLKKNLLSGFYIELVKHFFYFFIAANYVFFKKAVNPIFFIELEN